ncbi:MAG: DNA/RNA non-specific endonuclease [Bryobacteraceae bacterium]
MRATLLFLPALLLAGPADLGLPACSGPAEELANRTAFVLCHSADRKTAVWTVYELRSAIQTPAAARPKHFRRDTALATPGAADSDYRNSGWVRGHLVPAADLSGEQALRDSFLLSNAVPQDGSLNSGKWRLLEDRVRSLAAEADFVIVFTGPVFCSDSVRIGVNNVAVPCALFKVAVASRNAHLTAYAAILPNTGNPTESLRSFYTSVAEVERQTGLDFLSALPAKEKAALEASVEPIP